MNTNRLAFINPFQPTSVLLPRSSATAAELHRWLSPMRKLLACLILSAMSLGTFAQAPDAAKEEIEHLLGYLAGSHCEFARNGTWYSASSAAKHLRDKYDHILRKGRSVAAEQFIELIASRSSVSGNPYLVRCGNNPADTTGQWFRAELRRYRASKPVTADRSLQPTSVLPLRTYIAGRTMMSNHWTSR